MEGPAGGQTEEAVVADEDECLQVHFAEKSAGVCHDRMGQVFIIGCNGAVTGGYGNSAVKGSEQIPFEGKRRKRSESNKDKWHEWTTQDTAKGIHVI